jgi:hypothetical protein
MGANRFSFRLGSNLSSSKKVITENQHSSCFHQLAMEAPTSSMLKGAPKVQTSKEDLTTIMEVAGQDNKITMEEATRVLKASGCSKNSNSK